MLEEANFQERIRLLELKDTIDQMETMASPEDQAQAKKY